MKSGAWLSLLLISVISIIEIASAKRFAVKEVFAPVYDTSYIEDGSVKIERGENNTLELSVKLVRDFPLNTYLLATVYEVNSDNSDTYLMSGNATICGNINESYDYLPPYIHSMGSGGRCPRKGEYSYGNAGQFQFDRLLDRSVLEKVKLYKIIIDIHDGPKDILHYDVLSTYE